MGKSVKRKRPDTQLKKRTKSKYPSKKSKSRSPEKPNYPMIGYEDDQQVRRNIVIIPIFSWETSHHAFFQTSGTSNVGSNIYSGTWLPTTGCLNSPVHEFGTGHIVKLGPINNIHTPSNVVPAWILPWFTFILSMPEYKILHTLLQNPLVNIQMNIQDMNAGELHTLIPMITGFLHIYKFTNSYFLTWEQLQISAQISDTGFWEEYPDLREFVLAHDWRENAFVNRATPIKRIHLGIGIRPSSYVDYQHVNQFLSQHDAFIEANTKLNRYTQPTKPELADIKKKMNAIQLYIENRALLLKIIVRGQRVFE
jgi:hypothetical protein